MQALLRLNIEPALIAQPPARKLSIPTRRYVAWLLAGLLLAALLLGGGLTLRTLGAPPSTTHTVPTPMPGPLG